MAYVEIWFKAVIQPALDWLRDLPADLLASLSDFNATAAIVVAIVLGAAALMVGLAVGRFVGVIHAEDEAGRAFAIGLAIGLVVVASTWAAIRSGGDSSFTPIPIALALGVAIRLGGRRSPKEWSAEQPAPRSREAWARLALLGALFLVAVGLIYGTTMAKSPRSGMQPLESADEAFYSTLAADLVKTGVETPFGPGGITGPGLPQQSWYHWGEIWLASIPLEATSIGPIFARHYVALPLVLLAACALSAVVFRRLTGERSRRWLVAGGLAGALLAPMPLLLGPFFGWWARAALFTVTQYGLAIVVVLVLIELVLDPRNRACWAKSVVIGCIAASLFATHVIIAVLAAAGIAGSLGVRWLLRPRHAGASRTVPPEWRPIAASALVISTALVGWGFLTGHGLPSAASDGISSFGGFWAVSVASTLLTAGVFVTIPIAWWIGRRDGAMGSWLDLAAVIAVALGGILWGLRIGDYNTFHAYFGAILALATPLAVAATWLVVARLRRSGHAPMAATLVALMVCQLAVGAFGAIHRLRAFGATDQNAVPVGMLDAINTLPADAQIAYSCSPRDEVAPWEPSLVALEAHAGRPLVPMCYEADVLTELNGGMPSAHGNPLFAFAPQRALYPDAGSSPSSTEIAAFLSEHRIEFLYVDASHPNRLDSAAMPIFSESGFSLLRRP